MSDPCTCPQCRILRELYGGAPVTREMRVTALAHLMHVFAGELTHVDDDSVVRVFQGIFDLRTEQMGKGAETLASTDLACMEVAGCG